MSKTPKQVNNGYVPDKGKGYQPAPSGQGTDGRVQGGYQPPSSGGNNPTNTPPNKK